MAVMGVRRTCPKCGERTLARKLHGAECDACPENAYYHCENPNCFFSEYYIPFVEKYGKHDADTLRKNNV